MTVCTTMIGRFSHALTLPFYKEYRCPGSTRCLKVFAVTNGYAHFSPRIGNDNTAGNALGSTR